MFCLFDSLNSAALGCYGGTDIPTPNFDRFSAQAVAYNNHFVGILPCMPARRDMHTGLTYHSRFASHDFIRGQDIRDQENDPWKANGAITH